MELKYNNFSLEEYLKNVSIYLSFKPKDEVDKLIEKNILFLNECFLQNMNFEKAAQNLE